MRTYDPSSVVFTFFGAEISGYAEGTFIKYEQEEDAYKKVVGGTGEVARTKTSNTSGSFTITLLQTSPSNDFLSSVAELDRRSNGGVGAALLKDLSGNTIISASEAWIRKQPSTEFGNEISSREWIIDTAEVSATIGGNQ